MTKLFSVIICTHNRPLLLKEAIASVVDQTLSRTKYELIIVDSASTDGTWPLCQNYQSEYPSIKCIHADQPGLNLARNYGWKAACGRFVAFLDDDAKASRNWLAAADATLAHHGKTKVYGLGGRILPFYVTRVPDWFKSKYETRDWGNRQRKLNLGESFSGSSMIFSRTILKSLGGFRPDLGMRKNQLLLGEETEFFDRFWGKYGNRGKLYYNPAIFVYHLVPAYKMRLRYFLKRGLASGQFWAIRRPARSLEERIFLCRRRVNHLSKQLREIYHKKASYSQWQNWVAEEWPDVFADIGAVISYLGLKFAPSQN